MPSVSVLLAVYDAQATLARSLQCLTDQRFDDFEIIVVDSSASDECARIVRERFPRVTYLRHPGRLLAHEALNRAVSIAAGRLLAFTDPDAYPDPMWLARLIAAHEPGSQPIAGGVACYGKRWIDMGAHFAKFDKWLPGGRSRLLTEAPTVNFLVSRLQFDEVGAFRRGTVHADTDFSWRLRQAGREIRFEPEALVFHHHLHTWWSLLVERYARGREFAPLWLTWNPCGRSGLVWRAASSILPLRLASHMLRVWRNARASRQAGALCATLPVVVSALYAWLLGEGAGYLRAAMRRS